MSNSTQWRFRNSLTRIKSINVNGSAEYETIIAPRFSACPHCEQLSLVCIPTEFRYSCLNCGGSLTCEESLYRKGLTKKDLEVAPE